jgi:putative FmdB family regulatory protein
MPTYEYSCENCGHLFEQLQSITASALRKCPKCRKTTLKRLIGTGAGLIFKGSGFYTTDYRSENYKESAKKEKPEKSGEKKETAATPASGKGQKVKGKSKNGFPLSRE